MRDDIWVEEDDQRRRPRSVLAVLAIAAVPWLVVAGVVLLPDRDRPPTTAPESRTHTEVAPSDHEDASDATEGEEATGSDDRPTGSVPGQDRREEDGRAEAAQDPSGAAAPSRAPPGQLHVDGELDRALAATATIVARAWATGVDPHLDIPGVDPADGARYAEHVAVEAIERSGSDLAVVTLVAVLLEDLDDGLGAELRRIAVPLAILDGEPRLAGVPWWLPPPEVHPAEVAIQAETDPAVVAAAGQALDEAGYDDLEVLALYRTPGWPWIVELVAIAPGGERVVGEVWLRREDDRFVLAGQPPRTAHQGGGER